MSVIQLLHGTDHIIEVPDIHIGNPHNDYGMGFYCTRVDEMAREWACKKNADGFVNSYDFDTEGLKLLNLLDGMHISSRACRAIRRESAQHSDVRTTGQ